MVEKRLLVVARSAERKCFGLADKTNKKEAQSGIHKSRAQESRKESHKNQAQEIWQESPQRLITKFLLNSNKNVSLVVAFLLSCF